jgi:methyl-accepting chemotaxis protein
VQHASRTGEALESIRKAVSVITDLSTHIAEVSERQSHSAGAVNSRVESISQVARSTVEDASELAHATEDLLGLAQELESMVGRFRA